jgi:glycosyltransferase involved in cell wall biosynthesis
VVDVVLPALDEADGLRLVLPNLPPGYRAVVVDNGSTDDTAAVAASLGALVVHEARRGFGAACWAGLSAATADVVAFMDADASFDPGELPLVVGPVEAGRADLVLGARRPAPGSWPAHARLANRVLAWRLRRGIGVPLTDLGPMRAARREALVALGIADRRSGWPLEMVLRAAEAGWRIEEATVSYRPRVGRSKVTGTVRGTVTALADMSRALAATRPGPGEPAAESGR